MVNNATNFLYMQYAAPCSAPPVNKLVELGLFVFAVQLHSYLAADQLSFFGKYKLMSSYKKH